VVAAGDLVDVAALALVFTKNLVDLVGDTLEPARNGVTFEPECTNDITNPERWTLLSS
jgi:hypothetical protein